MTRILFTSLFLLGFNSIFSQNIPTFNGGLLIVNQDGSDSLMIVNNNGIVGIGTGSPDSNYTLSVDGGIKTKNIRVTQYSWADFVLEEDYLLSPLSVVKAYIEESHHLPGIPSQEEVLKNGVDVAETHILLLQKIEEITLYLIEMEERALQQDKRIKELESSLK